MLGKVLEEASCRFSGLSFCLLEEDCYERRQVPGRLGAKVLASYVEGIRFDAVVEEDWVHEVRTIFGKAKTLGSGSRRRRIGGEKLDLCLKSAT